MHFSFEQYHSACAPLEGRVPGLYCDILGLITCAVGNLIDPVEAGAMYRWTLADGTPADKAQYRADWHKLKSNASYYAKRHWKFALADTLCRLTDAEIDRIVKERLAVNEMAMLKAFPEWHSFPADAQLAIMSMCWAVGAGWPSKFPNLKAAVLRQDWEGCVASCKIREEGNPGVVPRNALDRFCFHNAATVKRGEFDPKVLHWPNVAHEFDDVHMNAAGAKVDAELQLAAWHALETCPYVPESSGRASLGDSQ